MSVKTTHVGSLPRPENVSKLLFKEEAGEPVDLAFRKKILEEETVRIFKKQKEAGVDIPSDGEMSKISYATYIGKRVSGFGGDSERIAPADLEVFPGFLKKMAVSGGTPTYKRPKCIEKLGKYDPTDLLEDLERFRIGMEKNDYQTGFMNAASPGVIAMFQSSDIHKTREAYLQDLAEIMKEEYRIIVAQGIYLQIDAPDLALGRHMTFKHSSEEDFLKQVKLNVEILNYALENIPKENVRLHLCWGNYTGPHHCDIEIKKLLPTLFDLNIGILLFEGANPRHAHEWTSWKESKIPDDLILIPGVIDSTVNFIEHPELVAQRLRNFINIVGKERVIGGSDCGFSTFAGFGAVDEEIAFEKLKSLRCGADSV